MINWTLKKIKISDLKEHPKNPRRLTDIQGTQLKKSLEKYGAIEKPIVNLDNTIIGGHQRLKILKKMKVKEIECWVPDAQLDQKDVDELNIRLNKNQGEWDWEILANEWDPIELVEWGFNADEMMDFCVNDSEELESDEEKPQKIKNCPHCGLSLN